MELRLRVNPLPAQLWGKNLRSFMSKARWSEHRQTLIDQRGSVCETCNREISERIQAHEEWELDLSVQPPAAKLQRIALICWHCHMCEHFGRLNTMIANRKLGADVRNEVIDHFCSVNSVERSFFSEHYTKAMAEWERLSRMQWLVDWGEFKYLLPKVRLREHYDPDGNPVGWLSFDHIDANRMSAFLFDLGELSRFYGVWIGQTNKRRLLPLHMREPTDKCGEYRAEIMRPWGAIPARDSRVGDFGAFMGWTDDPCNPIPPRE